MNLVVTAGDAEQSVDGACDPEPAAKTYDWQVCVGGDAVTGPYTNSARAVDNASDVK